MEDSNNDEFQTLGEDTTNDDLDDAYNVPLPDMGHTEPAIKKEVSSFYNVDFKQDDIDVANTENKDQTCVCNSPGFTQPKESNAIYVKSEPQDESVDNTYYDDKVVCDVKCEPQEASPYNTHHDYNSFCDVKYEPKEISHHNTHQYYKSHSDVTSDPEDTSTDKAHNYDNSVSDEKSGTQEEQDQLCMLDDAKTQHVHSLKSRYVGSVYPILCVPNVSSTLTGLQKNSGEL